MPVAHKKLTSIGNYDLLEKIADGGTRCVYRGRSWTTGETVAVKVVDLPKSVRINVVLLRRFEQEFRAASALKHPNIVRALDYGQEGAAHYLVMEFIDGESLGDRIEREGALPEDEAVAIAVQIAQALDKVHEKGMIHRDVKPDNILISRTGQAKLIDLGLVKDFEAEQDLTKAGFGLGTPNFIAPEQFRDAKHASKRCDVYSLGATLYMAVTGELPFGVCSVPDLFSKKLKSDLPAPRSLAPNLSEVVEEAIRRAMNPDPAGRPASCRRFAKDLTRGADASQELPVEYGRAEAPRQEQPPKPEPRSGPRAPSEDRPTRNAKYVPPPSNDADEGFEVPTWLMVVVGVGLGLLGGLVLIFR